MSKALPEISSFSNSEVSPRGCDGTLRVRASYIRKWTRCGFEFKPLGGTIAALHLLRNAKTLGPRQEVYLPAIWCGPRRVQATTTSDWRGRVDRQDVLAKYTVHLNRREGFDG